MHSWLAQYRRSVFKTLLTFMLLFSYAASAACVSPAGTAGSAVYNFDYHVMQYCNGTDWYSMTGGSSGGSLLDITGDVTASGVGTVSATIPDNTVTYSKMQDMSASGRLLGRASAGAGDPEEIIIGSGLNVSGTTLSTDTMSALSAMSTTARDALPSPATGTMIYNTDTHTINIRVGSVWAAFSDDAVHGDTGGSTTNSYRYIRMEISAVNAGTAASNATQLSEFQLRLGTTNLNWNGSATATAGGSTMTNEEPVKLLDGSTSTKWYEASYGSNHTVTIDNTTPITFDGYRWATGNDTTGRDPVSWQIYGSTNGTSWDLLDTQTNQTITTSRTTYVGPWTIGSGGTTIMQQVFTESGTFTVPTGVSSISAVCVGAGGNATTFDGGRGGDLRYITSTSVTPGENLSVVIGTPGVGASQILRSATVLLQAASGNGLSGTSGTSSTIGGSIGGGNGGIAQADGGGGAGGYSGAGGTGAAFTGSDNSGTAGSGGGGGGGGSGINANEGGGGGGVGLLGAGSNGAGGHWGGGGGGSGGGAGKSTLDTIKSLGGLYGGGGGAYSTPGTGGSGACRLIWGSGRAYPSTNTGDM